jgi:hypothetical protein
MKAHIHWPENRIHAPVLIEIGKSATEILAVGYLTTILKTPGVQTIGVMLDADTSPKGRYSSLRSICLNMFPGLPADLPYGGLIAHNAERKRLGIWIMPDNSSDGSLETFLKHLVPPDAVVLWNHAISSAAAARGMGAGCRDPHIEKSNLFTWLAWQDPPGQKPGLALTKKVLDPHSPSAASFVKWFKDLYGF